MLQKNFDILSLNVLHNYFNSLIKLFSNLYLTKFLGISAKPFFPYIFCSFAIKKLSFLSCLKKKNEKKKNVKRTYFYFSTISYYFKIAYLKI